MRVSYKGRGLKGYKYEKATVDWYKKNGIGARREKRSQGGEDAAPDVELEDSPNLFLECKHKKSGGLVHRAYEEAKAKAGDKAVILHTTENYGEHLVTMERETWMRLLKLARGWSGKNLS